MLLWTTYSNTPKIPHDAIVIPYHDEKNKIGTGLAYGALLIFQYTLSVDSSYMLFRDCKRYQFDKSYCVWMRRGLMVLLGLWIHSFEETHDSNGAGSMCLRSRYSLSQ